MPHSTIHKTVHQYNREPITPADMKKLQEIADAYSKVKNHVYLRFGGIGSLGKLYPGFTVQNEMTKSGLRGDLLLPSVYFYLAVFDALSDIKSQWTRTKSKLLERVGQNEGFMEDEKHYLRFVLKINNLFTAVLTGEPVDTLKLPKEIQAQYAMLAARTDTGRLHRYLCRQVRKHHVKPHTRSNDGFAVSERAYRYDDGGIYISTRENRKRIFIPLTDRCSYKKQLFIKLFPKENRIELKTTVEVRVKSDLDYTHSIGISLGMFTMLVTHEGHRYGEQLGIYHTRLWEWVREQTAKYNENRQVNPGRKKYQRKKNRLTQQLHSYINQELNRFLETEKPETVYIPRLPPAAGGGNVKRINHSVTMWQRGYIKNRLAQKCREHSVMLVEVFGKDISNECCHCGALGSRKDGVFTCPLCGCEDEKTNSAGNAKKRGESKS